MLFVSIAIPFGLERSAEVTVVPSALYPAVPVPATKLIVPVADNLKIWCVPIFIKCSSFELFSASWPGWESATARGSRPFAKVAVPPPIYVLIIPREFIIYICPEFADT